tara:strand:+ start:322 stop:1140 length:819 start_codon:yes stop_codon:yes gene_type:complete
MRRIIILLLILPTATAQIEITEIMYDLPGADGKREWIEIHNAGNETDISGWRFFENGQHHKFKNFTDNLILATDEYVVIANKPEAFLNDTNFTGKIIDSSWSSLANSGEPLVLRTSKDGPVVVNITYLPTNASDGNGASLQLIEEVWQACEPTPGQENFCYEPEVEEITEPNQTEETNESEYIIDSIQSDFKLIEEPEEVTEPILEYNNSIEPEIQLLTVPTTEPTKIQEPEIKNKLVKLVYESENKGHIVTGFYLFLLASLFFNIMLVMYK